MLKTRATDKAVHSSGAHTGKFIHRYRAADKKRNHQKENPKLREPRRET
jgi:hypothetical protein